MRIASGNIQNYVAESEHAVVNGIEVKKVVLVDGTTGSLSSYTGGKLDVNATVTATIDTTGLATSTIQTDGSQKIQIVDPGGEQVTVTGGKLDVNASVDTTGLALATNQQTDALTNTQLRATPVPVTATIDTTGLATTTTDTNTGTIAGDTTSIDGKIPALGQALAASSVPVVLTANQITTLTPPAAITGFATSAKQLADNHQVTVSNIASTPVITGFATAAKQLADGHSVALSATDNAVLDAIQIGTDKIPVLGQALAAASVPVILPSATITTLTPPAAITGFSTAAKQLPDGHTVALSATDNAVLDAIETDTTTLAGGVTGGHYQVDVLSMPAGGSGLTDTELRATPVPISGTVTANAGTNLNTSTLALEAGGNLAAIKAKTDNIPAQGQALAAASIPVVLTAAQVTTLTPPVAITGFATSAKQDTLIGHVDGIEGLVDGVETLLETIDTDTSNISTKIDTLAGAVSATHMQVDVLTAPTTAVTGTFYQATQPVSIATMPSTPVTGTFYQATQPVSGTVTANLSATDNTVLDNIDTSTASKYITGIGHGVKVVTTAGTDVVLAASTVCKRVIIQAQTDNTSLIAVGGSGVDATIATGTGIILNPGDAFEMDMDNLTDVYIDSLVNGEGVRFSYWT